VAPADVSSGKTTCRPFSDCAQDPKPPIEIPLPASNGTSWAGSNHYFLHTLPDWDQTNVIRTLKDANVKHVRLFLSSIYAGNKGTTARQTDDLEQNQVGTYNDDVLRKLDGLLPKLEAAGIKAIVAFHDRYMLGAWGRDAYVSQY
jgi:mannan endo-1,4-beta-mannosidase